MGKHALSLILILALAIGANAQSLLRVHLADNSRMNISVNGRYFYKQGTTVTVGDLPPGRHYLKIYKVAYDRWGRMFDRLVFQGTVNTSLGMVTNFLYDPRNRTMSATRSPIDDSRNRYAQTQPNNRPYRDNYSDDNDNYEAPTSDNAAQQPIAQDQQNATNPPAPGAAPASPIPAGSLTDAESDKLKTKVDAKATDTEKLKYLKDALKNETITTFQVSYMMDWFLFESSKVDFAKWAYAITTDKDFYNDLSSKFNYDSSKEELQRFLSGRR